MLSRFVEEGSKIELRALQRGLEEKGAESTAKVYQSRVLQILSEELVRAGVLPADYDFEAHKELVPMQPGDVPVTFADTEPLERDFGFKPHTPLREGLRKFAEWYKKFYME